MKIDKKPSLSGFAIDDLLWHENTILGTLYHFDYDFPWCRCYFTPTSAFEQFRPLFERLRELQDYPFDWDNYSEQDEKIENETEQLSMKIFNLSLCMQSTKTGTFQRIADFNMYDNDVVEYKPLPSKK